MSELDSLESDIDQSGVHSVAPMDRALRLVAAWTRLQPQATQQPAQTRALSEEVSRALGRTMDRLVACDSAASPGVAGETTTVYELLDTTYVLERLDWCVLHNVPYVDRPRSTR